MAGGGLATAIVPPDWADGVDLLPGGPAPITAARRGGTAGCATRWPTVPEDRYDALLLDCPPTLGGPTIGA